jgi:signal transduction histidine kinase
LAELNRAAKEIASGDLNVRVNIASHDEVGQLGETFNGMVASLSTQESLRRNFMADVAHELRTPLTGIQGTVEAMQDGVFPLSVDQLDSIHEGVLLLNRLVEDLRTLAHAEAGQLSLRKMPVDLAVLAARAPFRPTAPRRNSGRSSYLCMWTNRYRRLGATRNGYSRSWATCLPMPCAIRPAAAPWISPLRCQRPP